MREQELKKLLNGLADATAEPVDSHLAEQVKARIPRRFGRRAVGWDRINIMVDLRISRLAAAAVIMTATLLLTHFFEIQGAAGDNVYQDSELLIRYYLAGSGSCRSNVLAGLSKLCDDLTDQGREVVFYGDSAHPDDRNAIIMYWGLEDGKYRVLLNDLSIRTLSAKALIRLQSWMLKNQAKK
jgi:hypothetical protein